MTAMRLLAALSACLIAAPCLAGRAIERPGIGYSPAFVCLATTIGEDGHTKQTRIIRRSGNFRLDRHALRLFRATKFVPPKGESWGESERRERDVRVLIRLHGNGAFADKVYELTEPLPEICSSPYESVAKDAEINARHQD